MSDEKIAQTTEEKLQEIIEDTTPGYVVNKNIDTLLDSWNNTRQALYDLRTARMKSIDTMLEVYTNCMRTIPLLDRDWERGAFATELSKELSLQLYNTYDFEGYRKEEICKIVHQFLTHGTINKKNYKDEDIVATVDFTGFTVHLFDMAGNLSTKSVEYMADGLSNLNYICMNSTLSKEDIRIIYSRLPELYFNSSLSPSSKRSTAIAIIDRTMNTLGILENLPDGEREDFCNMLESVMKKSDIFFNATKKCLLERIEVYVNKKIAYHKRPKILNMFYREIKF